ncbi:MAG TPA: hypothetical protein VOA78_00090 [Candidatus Dormibacteraeota bacterium]|nr:hypothetical protein [Candidatus Dormibacteraeota bacterium]
MRYAKRQRSLWILLVAGMALLAAVAARGTTLVTLRFDELAGRATAVARVRCVNARSFMERGEIWTETQFEVVKSEKGLLGELVTVRLPGGRAEGLHARVDGVPEFAAGEEVYLFLWGGEDGTPYRVLGWTQGTFRIRREAKSGAESVRQDSAASAEFDPTTRTFRHEGVREMTVARFEEKLRGALAGGAR